MALRLGTSSYKYHYINIMDYYVFLRDYQLDNMKIAVCLCVCEFEYV